MVIWDNLNIAFKVSKQRHNSKDHLIMELPRLSFHYMMLNLVDFHLNFYPLVTVEFPFLSLGPKIFSQLAKKLSALKPDNFGIFKTFYTKLSHLFINF